MCAELSLVLHFRQKETMQKCQDQVEVVRWNTTKWTSSS